MEMMRQGDVLLIKLPDAVEVSGSKVERDEQGRIVVMEGELTGHAHAIHEADVEVQNITLSPAIAEALGADKGFGTDTKALCLSVADTANLVHEEHDPIRLEKGRYVVVRQREYTPVDDGMAGSSWVLD